MSSESFFDQVLVYQSHGQLTHLFGKSGAQEIMESCGQQIILGGGIRDIDSAKRLSDTVGKTTIYTDDPLIQADRAHRAQNAMREAMWSGANMVDALNTYEHELLQSQQQRQAGRYSIDPAEMMRLSDQVLVLTPGVGLPAFLGQKLPRYYQNPAMVGRYGPDPLFPPMDRVTVPRRFFFQSNTRPFIREAVPEHLAHMPNHSNGQIAYVKGHRPW